MIGSAVADCLVDVLVAVASPRAGENMKKSKQATQTRRENLIPVRSSVRLLRTSDHQIQIHLGGQVVIRSIIRPTGAAKCNRTLDLAKMSVLPCHPVPPSATLCHPWPPCATLYCCATPQTSLSRVHLRFELRPHPTF